MNQKQLGQRSLLIFINFQCKKAFCDFLSLLSCSSSSSSKGDNTSNWHNTGESTNNWSMVDDMVSCVGRCVLLNSDLGNMVDSVVDIVSNMLDNWGSGNMDSSWGSNMVSSRGSNMVSSRGSNMVSSRDYSW